MKKRRTPVLAVLAKARPARLDAATALTARWPRADQLIEAAQLGDDDPVHDLDHGHHEIPPRPRPLVPVKLLGALTSAAVTAVVIVIAVAVGTIVLRGPHGQPAGTPSKSASASTSLVRPPTGSPVFRPLSPGPHWHGHLAFAVSNGVVYLAGIATVDPQGSQSGLVATLPRSARPLGRIDLVVSVSTSASASGGGAGAVEIGADGQIQLIGQRAGVTWVSLSGVSFPAGSR